MDAEIPRHSLPQRCNVNSSSICSLAQSPPHLLSRHTGHIPPPINTEATTITTSLPEITPFIALQLRVARLEQEMSEVKKTDHSADVVASIRSQIYSRNICAPGPESIQNQESKKSLKEIIRIKKEQGEEKQDSTYSIRSSDKVDLEEFDLKKNDDDEGPSAGSNQGKSTKRRRHDSGAFCSLNPTKDDDKVRRTTRLDASDPNNIQLLPQLDGRSLTQEILDEGHVSDMEDTDNAHIPKVSTTTQTHTPQCIKFLRKTSFKGRCMILGHSSNCTARRTGRRSFAKADLEVDLSNPRVKSIPQNRNETTALTGGPLAKNFQSLSSSKPSFYLDFGLEELVPSLWVESEREYDISAVYGITHWWFRRKEFYINKHSESSDREAVRSQMRILSVISVKVFEKYGYNYLREIILRRADYQEYKISEKDFKNLHPNDFEDLFLLNIQEKLNHLPKTDKTSLHTAVAVSSSLRLLEPKRTIESRAKRSSINLVRTLITMAEFLRLPNFKGCKVAAGTLLLPGAARVTHLAPPAGRLEDIPPKTGDMMVAKIPCRKFLDNKENKKRKAEEKTAA
ncbi:hypothetical protein Tco_0762720 [Tanacetum coccineum]